MFQPSWSRVGWLWLGTSSSLAPSAASLFLYISKTLDFPDAICFLISTSKKFPLLNSAYEVKCLVFLPVGFWQKLCLSKIIWHYLFNFCSPLGGIIAFLKKHFLIYSPSLLHPHHLSPVWDQCGHSCLNIHFSQYAWLSGLFDFCFVVVVVFSLQQNFFPKHWRL